MIIPDGVEVHVQVCGDSFTLHRTGCSGGTEEFRRPYGNRTFELWTGPRRAGYSATNSNGYGPVRWVYIPIDIVGSLVWAEEGSKKEIKFSDVEIGPSYFKWEKNWHLGGEI